MSDEKPLHVRVAEALGWRDLVVSPPALPGYEPMWVGTPPSGQQSTTYVAEIDRATRTLTFGTGSVPRYDTDWSATGPLIERYDIGLAPSLDPRTDDLAWRATRGGNPERFDPKPLVAVCHLLLALHEAGRLKP